MEPIRSGSIQKPIVNGLLARQASYDCPTKSANWEVLANAFNTIFSRVGGEVSLKERGFKERLDLLLRKHKQEDTNALKRYM